jgi:hypothetical protein
MYLARLTLGSKPQVFHLTGFLFAEPKSWSFCSYRRGACAIGYTQAEAVQAARRRLEMPKVRPALRVMVQRGGL